MKRLFLINIIILSAFLNLFSQTITVTVSGTNIINAISPWIYGRNNNISDDPNSPTTILNWNLYKEAGLRMYRENGGNNSTKYNWRAKLSSHPDWYNNVYNHDWDYSAKSLIDNTSQTQGFFGLSLLGKVADNKNNNFNDWQYTQANGYINNTKNWAGGGGPSTYGGNNGNGNPNLYLRNWPADSVVGIFDQWFIKLNFDSTRFRYWNMDNEPEIWNGTHDDVISSISGEAFMQKYFAVAKAARAKYPSIKLVGPVSPNEWQWYAWNNAKVLGADSKSYPWMEYFIKRVGEEQKATGIRLLDVLDVHFYPGSGSDASLTLQLHNLWFDSTWVYPGANGVKLVGPSGWNSSVNKEYLFARCNNWLRKYIGANHNVNFGISEYGDIASSGSVNPNVIANWYASHLGTFANNKVELFTPWDWYVGQWEVLHLFSRYFGKSAVKSKSSNETTLSTYSSLTTNKDTLVLVVVNRDQVNSQTAQLNIQGFTPSSSNVSGFELANLPNSETFVSHSSNALVNKSFTLASNKINVTVPKLSVTLIRIPGTSPLVLENNSNMISKSENSFTVSPNPAQDKIHLNIESSQNYSAEIYNMNGQLVKKIESLKTTDISTNELSSGVYIIHLQSQNESFFSRFSKE